MINKHAIDHFFKPSPFSSAAKRTDWTLLLLSLQIKNSICKSASKKLNSCRELTYVLKIMPQRVKRHTVYTCGDLQKLEITSHFRSTLNGRYQTNESFKGWTWLFCFYLYPPASLLPLPKRLIGLWVVQPVIIYNSRESPQSQIEDLIYWNFEWVIDTIPMKHATFATFPSFKYLLTICCGCWAKLLSMDIKWRHFRLSQVKGRRVYSPFHKSCHHCLMGKNIFHIGRTKW